MKSGLHDADIKKHTAVYMKGTSPGVEPEELQRGMSKDPIAIHPASADQKLLPMSRLNFGKIYTVEHNVKTMHVGFIRGEDLQTLKVYHYQTFSPKRRQS